MFNDTWLQQGHSESCSTSFFCACESPDQTPHHKVKWAVSLVITVAHTNLPQGCVWVCIGKHTPCIILECQYYRIREMVNTERLVICL